MASVAPSSPRPQQEQELIFNQLQAILASEFFRNSQRCSRFLEYSVHHLLHQQPGDDLKERRVGIDVFGRPPDYDTARDNVVRVTANEVRKRLAQYYGTQPPTEGPVIDLPPGVYLVTTRYKSAVPPEEVIVPQALPGPRDVADSHASPTVHPKGRSLFQLLTALAVALILIVAVALFHYSRESQPIRSFWSPLLDNPAPILISIAEPLAYEPQSGSTVNRSPTEPVVPLRDAFVGVGDAYAMADITRFLTSSSKSWRLVAGNEVPSQDLRDGPVILIGAHSNLWTAKLMKELRFSFGENNSIVDHFKGTTISSLPELSPDWQTSEDYALVCRFRSAQTGQPVVILAGLTNYGTQAAGEFVSSPELLKQAFQGAPKNWQEMNFQFVLHTRLIGHTPNPPTVIASHFW
jgi:hypothetical protein